jgi:hypothetical protein
MISPAKQPTAYRGASLVADARKGASSLRAEVVHLRRLARGITDPQVLTELRRMIEELERRIAALAEGTDEA